MIRCPIGLRPRQSRCLGSLATKTLAEARAEANTFKKTASRGGDPRVERRREARPMLTFREAARQVHAAHAASFKNVKHRAQWLASLEADVFPVFGDRTVDVVESADVLKALVPLWTTKPETARRLKQRIKFVLDWAKASGYRSEENPVDGVASVLPKQKARQGHHAALPYAEVPALLQAVRTSDAGDATKLALEFLVLTGARTSEVLGARWEEIDGDSKTWTVPAGRIKAGREQRVPLSSRCIQILEAAEKLADGGGFIFPGRTPKAPLSNMALLMQVRRTKWAGVTVHGFSSSFRDWASEKTNFPRAVCEAALAHVVPDKTEAAYHRTDLFERRRKLMDAWGRFAAAQPAEVLQMPA